MALSPRYGQEFLWLNPQQRPAFTTTANRTPSSTSLRERPQCGGANLENIQPPFKRAIFCTYQAGCRIRNLILRRSIHFDGWLCEVRRSQSLSICLTISGRQPAQNRQRGNADEYEKRFLEHHRQRVGHGGGHSASARINFCFWCIRNNWGY